MSKSQIDNTFFEKVIMYNALMDESYLASVLDHMEAKYFEDKNVKVFYSIRGVGYK